jgi:acetyl-CoA carboxylase biotin carboxylase subunit
LARHVEVQILADGERAIHLFERECSLQRRRQKLVEEAPPPSLDSHVRQKMCLSAVALAESVGYRGVGTVEYLYDPKTSEFFFIEMNTRVQVENPITEMITGIDIVRESLRLATGEPLQHTQAEIVIRGAASMRKTRKRTSCRRQVRLLRCDCRRDPESVSIPIYTKATQCPRTMTLFLQRSS